MSIKFKSIRHRYIAVTLLIIIIAVLTVSSISLAISMRIITDSTDSRLQESVLYNSAELNSWFQQYGDLIKNTAQGIEINGDFSREYLENLLHGIYQNNRDDVSDFYMGFTDGATPVSGAGWIPPSGYDARKRPWYVQAVSESEVIYSRPYVDAMTGRIIVTVAQRVDDRGRLIGVIAVDIFITDIIAHVEQYSVTENSYGFLMDESGEYISHPEESFQPTADGFRRISDFQNVGYRPIFEDLHLTQFQRIEAKDFDGQQKLFLLNRIPASEWVFGVAVPLSDYHRPLVYLFSGFMIALLISVVIGGTIMLRLVGRLVRPIQVLNEAVRSFGDREMASRVEIVSSDEIGHLGASFNHMADTIQQYSETLESRVQERTAQLQEKSLHIQESIEYAKKIQESLLPGAELCRRLLGDYFVLWQPRDIVGGDFYWIKDFPTGFVVVVGDCTGHGVPGALMTVAVKAALDQVVDERNYHQPDNILNELNQELYQALGHVESGKHLYDGLDAGIIFMKHGRDSLKFAGAGMSLFVAQPNRHGLIKGNRHNIGYHSAQRKVNFSAVEMPLQKGTCLYLATDGIRDQIGQTTGLPFGNKQFATLLTAVANASIEEQGAMIMKVYDEHRGNETPRDDLTVVGFKV
jgi:serine phosphatase RsbU (regulator of sigma subunit)